MKFEDEIDKEYVRNYTNKYMLKRHELMSTYDWRKLTATPSPEVYQGSNFSDCGPAVTKMKGGNFSGSLPKV